MGGNSIELRGESEVSVTVPGEFPVVDRRIGFECSSGEWIERGYTGVPVEAVLAAVDLPGETTHCLVTARDGHVVSPAITDVLDGILAIERSGAPRLVAPGIAGPRAIKRVCRIEALELPPDADPAAFERVPPDAT